MKKAGKKLLSLLLAAMLVVSVLSPSFCALAAETKAIKSVETFENLQVAYGTPFAELGLPEQVAVTLDNEEEIVCDVVWDSSKYSSTYFSYWQHLSGTLVLPEGVSNPNNVTAEHAIKVREPEIVWAEEFEPIEVDYGFDFLSYLAEIHPTKKVRLEDGTEYNLDIMWTGEGGGFGYEPGQHLVVGHIFGDPGLTSPDAQSAQIVVTIREPVEILSVEPIEPLKQRIGTTPDQLLDTLSTQYSQVNVTISIMGEVTSKTVPVIWDVAGSTFNGDVFGTYTIYGDLNLENANLPSNNPNPNGVRAEIEVTIEEIPIVSLDKRGITVEQNTYLQPLNREYLLNGTPTTVTPPDTVMARLEGGSTEELPVVWHLEEFNPAKVTAENEDCQEIKGDLVIPEGSNIENPDGLIPKLEITVTPMTYKVAQASPKEISVEVYKGTTLAELNQQLEDEGLNEISIMATKPNNAVKRTFCKIFLEEGVNPDWDTQKEECGTYTLTASWPENIQPRSAKVPGPIHVNVTVKEPLEIKETKLAQANLYQGLDPLHDENTGNVPTQVTAVLEDDSEVEIDVEWDWSFFNKDSLTNPPIIGRLVNLPRKAKQPEGEEITGNMTIQMIPVQYTILKFSSISLTAKAGLTLEEITTLAGEEGSGIPAFERAFRFSGIAEDGKTFNVVRNIPFVLTSEDNPAFSSTAVQEYVLTIAMALPENISTEGASGYDRITLTTEPVSIAALEPVRTIDREGTPFAELANVPDQVLATLDVAGPDGVAKTARLTVNWGEGEGYTPFPEGLTDDDTSVTMVIEGSLENIPAYILPTDLAPTLSVTLGREFDIQSISLAQSDEVEVKLGTDFAAVDGLVNHEATLTLRCTNGETRIQTVSFELQESGYDPMTVGIYHLAGRLLVGSNVKNPENVSVEVVVRTMKYKIVESYALDEDIIMSVGEDPLDYLPGTVPALLSNDEMEEVPVNWDLNTIDTEVSDFYVVEGQYILPIYLENPDDCQPVAFVFVDEPESQIISMTQLLDNEEGRVRRVARREREIPGYVKHRYRVERLYKDGSVKEQIVTLYSKVS